jgi:hypothetical protein
MSGMPCRTGPRRHPALAATAALRCSASCRRATRSSTLSLPRSPESASGEATARHGADARSGARRSISAGRCEGGVLSSSPLGRQPSEAGWTAISAASSPDSSSMSERRLVHASSRAKSEADTARRWPRFPTGGRARPVASDRLGCPPGGNRDQALPPRRRPRPIPGGSGTRPCEDAGCPISKTSRRRSPAHEPFPVPPGATTNVCSMSLDHEHLFAVKWIRNLCSPNECLHPMTPAPRVAGQVERRPARQGGRGEARRGGQKRW